MLKVKIDEGSITDSNSVKPATSNSLSAKRSQTIEANGTISSLIFLTQTPTNLSNTDIKIENALDLITARKYILSGHWDLRVNNGKVSKFDVKFEQILEDELEAGFRGLECRRQAEREFREFVVEKGTTHLE